jgi:hypothetical protein
VNRAKQWNVFGAIPIEGMVYIWPMQGGYTWEEARQSVVRRLEENSFLVNHEELLEEGLEFWRSAEANSFRMMAISTNWTPIFLFGVYAYDEDTARAREIERLLREEIPSRIVSDCGLDEGYVTSCSAPPGDEARKSVTNLAYVMLELGESEEADQDIWSLPRPS